MNHLTGTHHRHRYAPRAWPPQIRIAAVVAACLVVLRDRNHAPCDRRDGRRTHLLRALSVAFG
jgi:hypothetical protein